MAPKPLMLLDPTNLDDLQAGPEAGMSFYVFESLVGFFAVFEDGATLPLHDNASFYCVSDLLNGAPLPTTRLTTAKMALQQQFPTRFAAVTALAGAVSPRFTGTAGAVPLVATYTLPTDAIFRRYLPRLPDLRFVAGRLSAGTYLTSELDAAHADSGFGAVGRYALPIPLPTTQVVQYELPAGTTIEVGTVAPNFGQAGGGVEVRLVAATSATQVGALLLSDY